MADCQTYQEVNYSVRRHVEPGYTRVTAVVKGLLVDPQEATTATNAKIDLNVSEDGEMGTIVFTDGSSYRIKIDFEDVGRNWLPSPDSYYVLDNDRVSFYLKHDPDGR